MHWHMAGIAVLQKKWNLNLELRKSFVVDVTLERQFSWNPCKMSSVIFFDTSRYKCLLICLATPWMRNCPNVHNHFRRFSGKGYHGQHWSHSLLRNKYSDCASQFASTQISLSMWTNYEPQMVKMTSVKSQLDKYSCFEERFRAEFLINTGWKELTEHAS